MTEPAPAPYQPRRPALVAAAVFVLAGLTLFWPILTGQFLAGPDSDQYAAGYAFRLFGAEYFREHGQIPLWNPYLFGGMPFVAAMHGDIFYPTAWLRWILPVDTAMNLGFAVHIVLAGCTMYAFLRALGVSWGGAVFAGLAYELTGIVASLVQPGHDGKLFVSALTPLVFLAILRAVRDRRASAYGVLALTIGLVLHGHPQMSYYLLVAAGLWGAWLVFLSPERPVPARRLRVVAAAVGAVALGFGLYAIQALPFIEYIPFSPRGEGGTSGGWEYATAFSMPPDELMSLVLPEFNGVLRAYWGGNYFKLHTEYIGVLPLVLAVIGMADRQRRPLVLALGGIGLLFLLISLGGHTPFYRLWYEVMPLMKKVRAPGMAFFLVAFPMAVFAGFGAERLFRGDVRPARALTIAGVLGAIGVLGVLGVLQGIATSLAQAPMFEQALRNEGALRTGALRLLVLALGAAGVVWLVARQRVQGLAAVAILAGLAVVDLWSVNRKFFTFQPPAAITYRDDALTLAMRQTPMPFRALDAGVYRQSWLMAHHIPAVLGYHGNEIRYFDDLMGGKNVWQHLGNPVLWDLYAVRFLVTGQQVEAIPGWTERQAGVMTATGRPAWLYEADSAPAWVRVVPAAIRAPEAQIIPTVLDPRFPSDLVVLYPDTAAVAPAPIGDGVPDPSPVTARLEAWQPGRMTVSLEGTAERPAYLVISENWYPDWRATVDGQDAPTFRAHGALLSAVVPPGAREVRFEFRSDAYERGRLISLVSLVAALGLLIVPGVRRRSARA